MISFTPVQIISRIRSNLFYLMARFCIPVFIDNPKTAVAVSSGPPETQVLAPEAHSNCDSNGDSKDDPNGDHQDPKATQDQSKKEIKSDTPTSFMANLQKVFTTRPSTPPSPRLKPTHPVIAHYQITPSFLCMFIGSNETDLRQNVQKKRLKAKTQESRHSQLSLEMPSVPQTPLL